VQVEKCTFGTLGAEVNDATDFLDVTRKLALLILI
jgi:hypothetical protein